MQNYQHHFHDDGRHRRRRRCTSPYTGNIIRIRIQDSTTADDHLMESTFKRKMNPIALNTISSMAMITMIMAMIFTPPFLSKK